MDFKRKRIFFNTIGAIATLITMLVFVFFVGFYVFCCTHIQITVYQFSMFPTINGDITTYDYGDTIMLNPYATIERGDVVVAENMFEDKTRVVKRLVGMPNDTVRIAPADGGGFDLFVNEQLFYHMKEDIFYPDGDGNFVHGKAKEKYDQFLNLLERYKQQESERDRVETNNSGQEMLKLRADEYFLLGDNWANSKDSLSMGTMVKKKNIEGKVDLVVDYNSKNGAKIIIKEVLKLMFCK